MLLVLFQTIFWRGREVNVSLGNWLINSGIRAAEVSHRWNRLSTASVTIGVVCPDIRLPRRQSPSELSALASGIPGVSHYRNRLFRHQAPPQRQYRGSSPASNITKTAAMGQLSSKMVFRLTCRRYRRMVSSRSGPTEMMLTGQPVSLSMKAT